MIIAIILLAVVPAHAEWGSWDSDNTKLHVPLTVLYWVDYKQTVWFNENSTYYQKVKHGWNQEFEYAESNTILGAHPSRGDIDKYFIGTYALTTALVYVLPEKWSHGLQAGVISIEVYAVNNNYQAGIGIRF